MRYHPSPSPRPDRMLPHPGKPVLICRHVGLFRMPAQASVAAAGLALPSQHAALPLSRRNWPVFHRVLAGLRNLLPPAFPVVVRTGALESGTLGACHRTDDRFVIRLAAHLDEQQAIDVLLHEWAHGLAWNHTMDRLVEMPHLEQAEFERLSHDGAWGLGYAQVWQTFAGEIVPRLNEREG